MHTQMRGIVDENVHTPFAHRKGRQTNPSNPYAKNDFIYQSKKQSTWAESYMLNQSWLSSDGMIALARACVMPTHAFFFAANPLQYTQHVAYCLLPMLCLWTGDGPIPMRNMGGTKYRF